MTPSPALSYRVVFNGSPDGEFWYQLKLTALNPKTVTLPEVQCELGRLEWHASFSNSNDIMSFFSLCTTSVNPFTGRGTYITLQNREVSVLESL